MTVSDFGNVIVADETTHKIYCGRYGTISLPRPVGVLASWKTGGGGPGEPPPFDDIFVSDAATNYVYRFMWRGSEAVAPASLGRVKALFK
jgi:hypothetical protein